MPESTDRNPSSGALWTPPLSPAAPRNLCTDCGLSRTSRAKDCGSACQFIRPDYPGLEVRVHGRSRRDDRTDESHFGVFQTMVQARLAQPLANAQWTGITTRIGERLLESDRVDAVLTVRPHPDDRWQPVPTLVTRAEDMALCRGMRMGFAPLLALLEPARQRGIKRLAVIGIPCQIYALRELEQSLGFDRIDVIGTPCSDNTTTERFHTFLGLLSDQPETIRYLEFLPDYHVELRFDNGRVRRIPFLQLPISRLPGDFFPLTCRTCVDYSNSLADLTVGYMGGNGEQWLLVRNNRGQELLDLIADELVLQTPISRGNRRNSVRGFIANVRRSAGGLPLRRMPDWLRPLVGWLMPRIGPRGLEFARARIEMKAAETVLHLRREQPRRLRHMTPSHIWRLLKPYGIQPTPDELQDPSRQSTHPPN